MSTRMNDAASASYAMHVAAKQNSDLRQNKMSAYTRYILFVISAIVSAISLFATAVCGTLAYTGASATWEMKMYSVALAAITITSAATAFFIADPLRVNLVIFDQFRALKGKDLSLDEILGMAYDYADVEEKHESIPRLVEEHERLTAENEKLDGRLAEKKLWLANINNRIAIDLAYDTCHCKLEPADTIGQLDQLAREARSAREALRAFNAAGDKDSLVPYCCKTADGRLRPILASWFHYTDDAGESQRGVVFYDTRGRSLSKMDLSMATANDWRLIEGKWVYCSPSNPFTGYAKGDPYGVDAFGRAQHYHNSSRIEIDDAISPWLNNGIAAASEDFDYAAVHKRLADDWQEKNRRWNDAIKANSTPDLPVTVDQE